jgi:hypothetical protein
MTLENFDEKLKKLNYKPKLATDAYIKLMQVPYNMKLISAANYSQILKDLGDEFQYDYVNATYSKKSVVTLNKFKKDIIPLRKTALDERAKTSFDQQKVKEAEDEQLLNAKLAEVDQAYEGEKKQVADKADDQAAEVMIDAEFNAQVKKQSIDEQKGIRKNITYSINDAILNQPSKVIDVLIKSMTNVMVDAKFKGIIKRDSQGFPKLDSDGKVQYVDGVSFWLKELAKLKIDINIENLNRTEDISTVVTKAS